MHLPVEQDEIEESLVLPNREKTIVYRIQIERKSGRFERSKKPF